MSVDILSHLFSGLSLLLSCKNSLFFITDFWQIRDLQISAPTPWVCLFTVLMLMTPTVFSCCSCFWCRVWGTVASSRAKHWPFPVDWPRHLGRSHLAVKGGARREGSVSGSSAVSLGPVCPRAGTALFRSLVFCSEFWHLQLSKIILAIPGHWFVFSCKF